MLNKVKKKEEHHRDPSPPPKPVLKRAAVKIPTVPVPPKKLKGILKNSNKSAKVEHLQPRNASLVKINYDDEEEECSENVGASNKEEEEVKENEDNNAMETTDALPEGFFDDPKLDAKVCKKS